MRKNVVEKIIRKVYKILNSPGIIRKGVKLGNDVRFYGIVRFHGDYKAISIGNNVNLVSSSRYNPTGGFSSISLTATGGGCIDIHDNVGISLAAITARKKITICSGTIIGAGVSIFDNDFHSIDWKKRMIDPDPDVKAEEVFIGKDVFIGARSIILKGVCIGDHSVIAAGSVVTRSIPSNEIWGGNPARHIKNIE